MNVQNDLNMHFFLHVQHAFSSIVYLNDTLFPASDHFLPADLESERLVPITRRVKLPSICQGACEQGDGQGHRVRKNAEQLPVFPVEEKSSHYLQTYTAANIKSVMRESNVVIWCYINKVDLKALQVLPL